MPIFSFIVEQIDINLSEQLVLTNVVDVFYSITDITKEKQRKSITVMI